MLIETERLRAEVDRVLRGAGCQPGEATIVGDHLIESNLRGHDSHGVGVLPAYVRNIAAGRLNPNRHAEFLRCDSTIAVVEGGMGFGQVIAREATDWAIGAAKANGLALLGLRNVHHVGRVGSYGEQAAAAGLIMLAFVNGISGAPRVAPHGGREPRTGTNPICIAVPHGDTPVVLDFATSRIALNKVRVARNEGRHVAPGSIITHEGEPSTDPDVLYGDGPRGALLPFGEHKGSGLSLICELLGGALAGGGAAQRADAADPAIINGLTAIMINPGKVVDLPWFAREVESVVAHMKTAAAIDPDRPVMTAGDPERAIRRKRLQEGIPVDATTWREIGKAAASVGVVLEAA
ncbi:malate/lactate/ureidoglycolate dehydrogenase [Roseomonas sp. WA12]